MKRPETEHPSRPPCLDPIQRPLDRLSTRRALHRICAGAANRLGDRLVAPELTPGRNARGDSRRVVGDIDDHGRRTGLDNVEPPPGSATSGSTGLATSGRPLRAMPLATNPSSTSPDAGQSLHGSRAAALVQRREVSASSQGRGRRIGGAMNSISDLARDENPV